MRFYSHNHQSILSPEQWPHREICTGRHNTDGKETLPESQASFRSPTQLLISCRLHTVISSAHWQLNWTEQKVASHRYVYSRSIYQVSKSKATGNQLNSSNKLKLTNLTTYNCRTARILKKQKSSSFYFSLKQHNLLIYLLGWEKGVPETCWWKLWWWHTTSHYSSKKTNRSLLPLLKRQEQDETLSLEISCKTM